MAQSRTKGKAFVMAVCFGSLASFFGGCSYGSAQTAGPSLGVSTNLLPYALRAGGCHNFVLLTNSPASNRVSIALKFIGGDHDDPSFWLTNREPHAILVWNVRVQTRSVGRGTDGFGWDTVIDDYPRGTPEHNSARFEAKSTSVLRGIHPGKAPWRICILYSIDRSDSGKSYSGNYEAVSEELKD